jgi:hypothetical protein
VGSRRLRIGVRLVLYPMLLGLIVVAWQEYHGTPSAAEPKPYVRWGGETSQGRPIQASTDEGRIRIFVVDVPEHCQGGGVLTFKWPAGPSALTQTGDTITGRSAGVSRDNSGRRVEFDNKLRAQWSDSPSGTLRLSATWAREHGPVACNSGPVTFTLHRLPDGTP